MLIDYFLVAFSIVLVLVGLVGCILPVIPGPPLAWLGLLLIKFTTMSSLSWKTIIVMAVVTILATLLDYLFPAWITKKMGGSNWGAWGTVIGLIIGAIVLGPIGVIVGPFLGALVGEIMKRARSRNLNNNPWYSAIGSLLGFTLGVGVKLITVGIIAYFIISSL